MNHSLHLLSYNIRYDNPADGQHSWAHRKDALAQLILDKQPDLFGIQEALHHQYMDLRMALSTYESVGVGRENGWDKGEIMGIFFLKDKFLMLEHGHFWLSQTPHIPGSISWESACPRMVTWVKLQDKQTNHIFLHFNTHFDHKSSLARKESASLLYAKVQEIASMHVAFITGDFNLTPSESVYKQLTQYFTDSRHLFPDQKLPNSTFNDFGRQAVHGMWIDYIFIHQPEKVQAQALNLFMDKLQDSFPSDHFPLSLKFEIL